MGMNMKLSYGFDYVQRIRDTQSGSVGYPFMQFDIVLAHHIIDQQEGKDSNHIRRFQSLRQGIINIHLTFSFLQVDTTTRCKTPMASTCMDSQTTHVKVCGAAICCSCDIVFMTCCNLDNSGRRVR